MKKYLANVIIGFGFVILSLLAGCSLSNSTQTPGVVIDSGSPVSTMPTIITSTKTENPPPQESRIPTETEQPTFPPSQTSTMTVLPSQVSTIEMIINSGKEEVGTLFVDTNGLIVRRLALGLELSAVHGANYVYRAHSIADGNGIQLDKIDFDGNVEESRVITIRGENGNQFFFNYSISPDGKWITYMHGDNDYDPRLSANMDLWLLNIEQKEGTPLVVAKNRRSTNEPVTWTSVGDAFVYADKDENGIVQLYEMHADSRKTIQITQFDASFRGQWIYQAKFSPDGNKIAFITITESGLGRVGVVNVEDKKLIWMQIPSGGYQPLTNPLWWSQSGSQIMVLITGIQASSANDSRIIWYDVVSGIPVQSFPENGQHLQNIEHAFPLKDIHVVGFWGYDPAIADKQYWLYDTKSKNLKKIDLPDLGLTRYQFIQLDNK